MPFQFVSFARLFLLCTVCCVGVLSCIPPDPNANSNTPANKVAVDLRDPSVRRAFECRDQHLTDSLLRYLKHPEATIRYIAALGFCAARDSNHVGAISFLLQDPVEEVRIAAAYALGQIGSSRAEPALIKAFVSNDSFSVRQQFNGVLLEALGKCGTAATLKNIAAVTTYQPADTLLLQGQCRAVYRFGRRRITDPSATTLMLRYLADEKIPETARLYAAHYCGRTEGLTFDSAQCVQLAVGYVRAQNPEIRMAIANSLGKSRTGPGFALLSKVLDQKIETDWRVKCNVINALAKYDYDTVRSLVFAQITDANVHVSRIAAEFFIANGQAQDGDYYWRISRDNGALPWATRVALFHASNRWLSAKTEPASKDYIVFRLKELFQNAQNPYERAACLRALAESAWQYRWIHDRGFGDTHPAVKSAAVEALRGICQRKDFYSFFGEGSKSVRRELYYYLKEAVLSADPGMITEAGDGFRVEALNFLSIRDSARVEEFTAVLQQLKMPRDVEAVQALEKTIAYLSGQPDPVPSQPKYNHPLNWNAMVNVTQQTQATIQTNKGSITIEFYPQWAPGSVANFIQLAKDGFYNKKAIHRVVPNFVVQGGCPRGDGYGGLDHSIRSEFGPVWYSAEGYIGMASAGADTEGTQWFITHSATPHLDGRYTIFARVISGMDIVHQLQQGDMLENVSVK